MERLEGILVRCRVVREVDFDRFGAFGVHFDEVSCSSGQSAVSVEVD